MTKSSDLHARAHLARANKVLIGVALGRAQASGAEAMDVVVVLIDTTDVVGRALAEAILEKSSDLNLAAEEARVIARGEIPTAITVLPIDVAGQLFGTSHPAVAGAVRCVPARGSVRVVAVAAGGVTLLHLPVVPVGVPSERGN